MVLNSLEFYKHIFENIPEGVLVCDENSSVIEINESFEKLTGYKKEELLGKFCKDFIVSDKYNCPVCAGEKGVTSENCIHTAQINNKEGKMIPVRISHRSSDKHNIFLIAALSDIAFLDQAHMDFVSTVSHELRTPLTSIKGFADTLLASGDKLDAENQKRFITIIKSQADRLTRLVENLLTVSRLESKKHKSIYKAIDFKNFLKPVIQNMSIKAKEHKIEVEITPQLPPVWADTDKLEQVMTNLIDNAVKYSNPNTVITVNAGYAPDNPDLILIKVKDQGVGIPKESLPKIFSKFSRIDNPLTRQVQGTGLGLYITKSLVESMGGKISVDSDEKGTEFSLMLSVATPEKHAAQKFME